MVEKRKAEAMVLMAAKRQRASGGIRTSSKREGNYESNIRVKIDPNQADEKYSP